LNTRLHPGEIAHLLDHSSPRLLFVDEEHADGETLGELIACGNAVAAGYFHNPAATREAFAGSWFRTGDLAVRHPDGSIEVRDRKKDVIISGGENISSIEVEQTLKQHPAVLEAAVVAVPDPRWGERPVAHIELRPGVQVAAAELTAFCRARLAAFKCPDHIQFRALPRTATGKVQKYQLREHG
jgi:fatty-acyl-CoA synthase